MENKKAILPLEIYYAHLTEINGVRFTPRETDVIACILNRRAAAISSFLLIGQRAVESHIRNIRQKAGDLAGRDNIIDFIETSAKASLIRNEYYFSLRLRVLFKRKLAVISKRVDVKSAVCLLVYVKGSAYLPSLIPYLKEDFKSAGFKVKMCPREKATFLIPPSEIPNIEHTRHVLYVLPENLDEVIINQINENHTSSNIFLFYNRINVENVYKNLKISNAINILEKENYYFSFFELLQRLLPHLNLESIIEEFKQQYTLINESFTVTHPLETLKVQKECSYLPVKKTFLKQRKWGLFIGSIMVIALLGAGLFFKSKPPNFSPINPHFLDRTELTKQIDQKFKEQRGIQTVAITGIGGAGKTTLARQYAHQHQEGIVWEINAENKSSVVKSFENFANALAKTKKDQKILKGLLGIMNPREREEKILSFVKESLRSFKSWFFIFDNVERLTDLQNHFPQDSKAWGEGKIIITTRDSNIKNNHQVNVILPIGELNPKQKLDLFMRIHEQGNTTPLTSTQYQQIIAFLERIPPYPLDVSIAAYYLNATKVPYRKYLKNIENYSNEFESIQENLLQEAGTSYLQTRYSIISLSLKKLIDTHKDFENLLLLISLLDSQDIPRDLLDRYKNSVVVDNIIYNLRKYSLVNSSSSSLNSDSTFSMHRSTQAIILTYLRKKLILDKNKDLVQSIGIILEDYVSKQLEHFNYQKMREISSHCETFLHHDSLLTDSIKGAINIKLAGIYTARFNPITARNVIEKALKIFNKNPSNNYEKIAQALAFLGYASWDAGNFEEAKAFHEQSLMIYKKHLPKNHLRFADALVNLAHVIRQLGHYEKSKNLLEEALSIYYRYYPEHHIRIAWSLSFLGDAYNKLGNYEKAKEVLEKSLFIYERYYPENYMGFHRIFKFFGFLHWKRKEYKKAKDFIEKSIDIAKKHFPNGHYAIEWVSVILGNVYKDLHEYKKARELLKKSLIFSEQHFGKDHFETAKILRDLGELDLLEDNIESAQNFLKRSLNIFQKTSHVEIYITLESLADAYLKEALLAENNKDIYQSKRLKSQALSCLKNALEVINTGLPVDSPHKQPIETKLKNLQE